MPEGNTPIGVYHGTLFQQFMGSIKRIYYNDRGPKDVKGYYTRVYKQDNEWTTGMLSNKYLPYRRPHSTKVTHSHFFGTSSTFPMTGSLFGPGGRGELDFLGRLTLEK